TSISVGGTSVFSFVSTLTFTVTGGARSFNCSIAFSKANTASSTASCDTVSLSNTWLAVISAASNFSFESFVLLVISVSLASFIKADKYVLSTVGSSTSLPDDLSNSFFNKVNVD